MAMRCDWWKLLIPVLFNGDELLTPIIAFWMRSKRIYVQQLWLEQVLTREIMHQRFQSIKTILPASNPSSL